MVGRAVVTGVGVGVALVCVLAWIDWFDTRGDRLMEGGWVLILVFGLPAGVGLGAALGLVGGLARLAGWPRPVAALASTAMFVGVVLVLGLDGRAAGIYAVPVAVLAWMALRFVDRQALIVPAIPRR